jgi:hypothetical protein
MKISIKVKTHRIKVSITRKQITYSFTLAFIDSVEDNKHRGTKKVVKSIKNREIPSTPKTILIESNHVKSLTN